MSSDELLTPAETAEYLRVPVRQLQQMRYLRRGPAYIKVGAAVRYRRGDLDTYLNAERVDPSAAA